MNSDLERVANAGKSFACGLYKLNPGAIISNPINDLIRASWDGLCGDDPSNLPPPPTSQFQGGQCVGVAYSVKVRFLQREDYFGTIYETEYTRQQGAFYVVNSVFVDKRNGRVSLFVNCNGYNSPNSGGGDIEMYGQNSNITLTILEIEVIRLDGQPDNCGNPPKSYPPPYSPPAGGYNSPPTIVNYNDGSDFTVNFNLVPPTGSDYKKPPDICLTVSWGGADVELCFPPDALPNFGGDGGGGEDIQNLIDLVNSLKNDFDDFNNDFDDFNSDFDFNNDPPDFDTDPDINKDKKEPEKKGEEDNIEGLIGVKISLTAFPSDAQFGTPNIYFAGWLTFKLQNGYIKRTPINFEVGYFPAPPGATGYAYTLVKGAEGEITVYTKVPEEGG